MTRATKPVDVHARLAEAVLRLAFVAQQQERLNALIAKRLEDRDRHRDEPARPGER